MSLKFALSSFQVRIFAPSNFSLGPLLGLEKWKIKKKENKQSDNI